MNAAITKQIVAIDLGSPALVELVTTFNYPYKLNLGDLTLTPPGKVANYTYGKVDCTVAENQICRQRWTSLLQLTPETCTLDGNYRMDWKVECGGGLTGTNCPLVTGDFDANVQFSLQSENFCAEVGVEVSLRGTLTSYEDQALTITRTAFIVGRVAYFLVKVNTELNGVGDYNDATAVVKFGTANLKLVTVTIRQVNTSLVNRIFEKGAIANPDTLNAGCKEIPKTVATVAFSFNFSSEVAKTLVQNSRQSFTVGAEVQVSYVQSKKRGLLQEAVPKDGEKATYATDSDVEGTTVTQSCSQTGTSNGFVVAITFALLFLSLFI